MLTDLKARQAKPGEADYKLADSGGLYLLVTKGGAKSWRLKYRFAGKEKRLTFGRYPEVTLAEAREKRDQARRLLREMRDPAVEAMKRRLAAATASARSLTGDWRGWRTSERIAARCPCRPQPVPRRLHIYPRAALVRLLA